MFELWYMLGSCIHSFLQYNNWFQLVCIWCVFPPQFPKLVVLLRASLQKMLNGMDNVVCTLVQMQSSVWLSVLSTTIYRVSSCIVMLMIAHHHASSRIVALSHIIVYYGVLTYVSRASFLPYYRGSSVLWCIAISCIVVYDLVLFCIVVHHCALSSIIMHYCILWCGIVMIRSPSWIVVYDHAPYHIFIVRFCVILCLVM